MFDHGPYIKPLTAEERKEIVSKKKHNQTCLKNRLKRKKRK